MKVEKPMSEIQYVIILQGYPISSSIGFLGWSTAVLIISKKGLYLVDTGAYNTRKILLERLLELGIPPTSIDGILLTHSHFDHVENIELFPKAKIYMSRKEYEYALSSEPEKRGDLYVAKTIFWKVSSEKRVKLLEDNEEVVPGLISVSLPGHTPGSMGYLIKDAKTIIVGDAVKNAYEYNRREPSLVFSSMNEWLQSIEKISRIANIIIPGHDIPFKIDSGRAKPMYEQLEIPLIFSINTEKEKLVLKINYEQNKIVY
ncbi:MAG: hypothetical protein DRO40_12085 [Thermoprotei archaeon]|nr:MAG: hypothetical protein DRO40_12085 [Thermoprotei archaeon]